MEDDLLRKTREAADYGVKVIRLYVRKRIEKLSDLLAENPKSEKFINKGQIKSITSSEAQVYQAFKKGMDMHEREQIFEVGRALGRLEAVELISALTLEKRKKQLF